MTDILYILSIFVLFIVMLVASTVAWFLLHHKLPELIGWLKEVKDKTVYFFTETAFYWMMDLALGKQSSESVFWLGVDMARDDKRDFPPSVVEVLDKYKGDESWHRGV